MATDDGAWEAPTVVLATGGFNLPQIPAVPRTCRGSVDTVTRRRLPRPATSSPDGGSSSSARRRPASSSRTRSTRPAGPVTLAVGEHVRMPRTYRGRDVMWWMERTGVLDERFDEIDDLVRGRNIPSPQLVGTPDHLTLDLNALTALGVALVGRLGGVPTTALRSSPDRCATCARWPTSSWRRLLDRSTSGRTATGADGEVEPPHRFAPTRGGARPALTAGPAHGADPHHHLGHRASAGLLLARRAGARPQGPLRHEGGVVTESPGPVPDRPDDAAAAQVQLHPWRRGRCRDLTDHLARTCGEPPTSSWEQPADLSGPRRRRPGRQFPLDESAAWPDADRGSAAGLVPLPEGRRTGRG